MNCERCSKPMIKVVGEITDLTETEIFEQDEEWVCLYCPKSEYHDFSPAAVGEPGEFFASKGSEKPPNSLQKENRGNIPEGEK